MAEGPKNYEPSPEIEQPQNLEDFEIDLFRNAPVGFESMEEKNKNRDDETDEDIIKTIKVNHKGLVLDLRMVMGFIKKENGELEGHLIFQPMTEGGKRRAYVMIDIQKVNGVYTATSSLARHGHDILSVYLSLEKLTESMLQKFANESRLSIMHNATTRGVQRDKNLLNQLISVLQAHGYSKKRESKELWEEWEKVYTPQSNE